MRESLLFNQGSAVSLSQATLISVVPFPIDEFKPGLIPGQFHVDACLDGRPVCVPIGDAHFYVYIDADRGNLRVPAPSSTLAKSICFDYNSAQLEAREECHPGFFWVPGIWDTEKVEKELQDELEYFTQVQNTWFRELIKRADDDWEKTRQHYAISDVQRHALRTLDPGNSMNRPWILVTEKDREAAGALELQTQLCPACGSDIPENVVICKYCHNILDSERYAKMAFAAAPTVGGMVGGVDLQKALRQ